MTADEHDTDRAARLAEVDAWLADLEPGCDGWYIETRLVRWLRDEVERYHEREATLVEIMRAVAVVSPFTRNSEDEEECFLCGSDSRDPHEDYCTWVLARALLDRMRRDR